MARRRAALTVALVACLLAGAGRWSAAPGGAAGSSAGAVAFSWGAADLDGQSRAGHLRDQPGPVALPAGSTVAMLRASPGASGFALALTSDGKVYGWGANDCGQLGAPATDGFSSPARVSGLPADVVAIDAADGYGLAVTASGEVWAWGRNDYGQLGVDPATTTPVCTTGGRTFRYQPARVPLPAGVYAVGAGAGISGGFYHALVLTSSRAGGPASAVYGWGLNGVGELGRAEGVGSGAAQPPGLMDLPGGVTPAQVSAGGQFSLLLASSGAAFAAGTGFGGELGNGQFPVDGTAALQPVLLGGTGRAIQLAGGAGTGLAVMSDGRVESWGVGDSGQRGDGTVDLKTSTPAPVALPATAKVTAVAISESSALAATDSGALYGWGDVEPLNQGTATGIAATPVAVPFEMPFKAVAVALGRSVGYALAEPAPQTGQSAVAARVAGTVLVRAPGGAAFRALTASDSIPVGSTVDVRRGTVRLTTTRGSGSGTQSATFRDGTFTLHQRAARQAITELRLASDFAGCPRAGRSAQAARRKRKPRSSVNSLWGDGKGRYTVTGHDGATAVKGTHWLTEDRCDGTFVRVRSGTVAVRDFGLRRTVSVRAGGSYLALRR